MSLYFLCFVLFCVGLYGLIAKRNLIKLVISITIMEFAANLLFVMVGFQKGGNIPIFSVNTALSAPMVDPLPQALVLTAMLIGLAVQLFMIALCLRLYEKYRTPDISEIRRLKG
jgi:multisubunit Na+/H+ antiporter MnhC subunit